MRFLDVITFVHWVGGSGPFHFEKCAFYLYMKTKVEITIHVLPFRSQGVGVFIYTITLVTV